MRIIPDKMKKTFNHDKLRGLIAKAQISLKDAYKEDLIEEKEEDQKFDVKRCLSVYLLSKDFNDSFILKEGSI